MQEAGDEVPKDLPEYAVKVRNSIRRATPQVRCPAGDILVDPYLPLKRGRISRSATSAPCAVLRVVDMSAALSLGTCDGPIPEPSHILEISLKRPRTHLVAGSAHDSVAEGPKKQQVQRRPDGQRGHHGIGDGAGMAGSALSGDSSDIHTRGPAVGAMHMAKFLGSLQRTQLPLHPWQISLYSRKRRQH